MRENSERDVTDELKALWTLTRLTIVDGELPPKPDAVEAARQEIYIAEKLIGWPSPNDFLPPAGAGKRAAERLAADGPASPAQTANAERFTTALRGVWDGERGGCECPCCREQTLVLMPRRARIEAYCPNCEGLAVEASVDALLDARGVVDFRPEFTWRDRPFMRP